MASWPSGRNASHWNHWSLVAWRRPGAAVVRRRGSAVVPSNVAPPSSEMLTRTSFLHAPGVLTPSYRPFAPADPVGTQPFASFELGPMYEPTDTTTWRGVAGLTAPDA